MANEADETPKDTDTAGRLDGLVGQELPGMLALAKAVQEGQWPHTTDAAVWAKEFLERFREAPPDEADMIAWFANAIMAGYDTAHSQMNKTPNAE